MKLNRAEIKYSEFQWDVLITKLLVFFFLLFTFTEKSHKNHIMLSHIEIDFLVRK